MLKRLAIQAGVPGFTAHQPRRTFGTEAASAGIPATELQALMGHEDLATTQRYIRVTGRDLERAMARLQRWRETKNPPTQALDASPVPGKSPSTNSSDRKSDHRAMEHLGRPGCKAK